MKKLFYLPASLFLVALCAGCWHFHGGNTYEISSAGTAAGLPVTSIRIRNGAESKDIKYAGEIHLNDRGTAIDSMEPNAFIAYRKDGNTVAAVADGTGKISYQYNDGSKTSAPDGYSSELLGEAIRELMNNGVWAKERMTALYQKGGQPALLTEIERIYRDDVKVTYYEFMLSRDSLTQKELVDITLSISRSLGSDNDKQNLLAKYDVAMLKDPAIADAYIAAVETLGSDYSKETLLNQLIRKNVVSSAESNKILDAIDHIGSDHAKENLLTQLTQNLHFSGPPFGNLMETIDHMGSDNAKENVLMTVIKSDSVAAESFEQLVNTITHIGNDNSKQNLYDHLIERKQIPKDKFEFFMGKVDELGNDQAKREIYEKLATSPGMSEDQWIALIGIMSKRGSDNDKGQFLIGVSKKLPPSPKLKAAIMDAAKSIQDDGEYGRTMKAIQ